MGGLRGRMYMEPRTGLALTSVRVLAVGEMSVKAG